jgi:glycosyltransferase 2 family protein
MRQERGKRHAWRWFSWLPGLVMLLALVAVVTHRAEGQRFALLLSHAQPAWLLAAAALQLATYLCAAGVWQRVLRHAGAPLAVHSLMPLAVARLFVDQILPTGGLGGRVLALRAFRRRGVRMPIAMAAILVDLLTLYCAFALVVLASLAVLSFFGELNHLILTLTAFFSLMAAGVPLAVLWLSGRERRPPRWARWVPRLESMLREIARAPSGLLRDPLVLAQSALLQLAIYLLDAATLWVMLRAIGQSAPPWAAFASFVLAQVAATVILTPGGLGSFEAAAVAMLALSRVPVEAALTATLLFRGFTYWLPMLPGLWLSRRELRHLSHGHAGLVESTSAERL